MPDMQHIVGKLPTKIHMPLEVARHSGIYPHDRAANYALHLEGLAPELGT